MPNLEGWVTPEIDFKGLYKVSDDVRRNRELSEQKAERKASNKLATDKFIESTYDPSNLFTGTLEDPNITSGMMALKNEAYQLSSQGVAPDMIQMALGSKAAKLALYSEKAKVLGRQWKEVEPILKTQKGIDLSKAKTEYENMAFRNEDGSIKDPSLIDHEKNYIDEVLRTKPVYNNEGITDFVTNSGKDTRINKITRINSKGGSYMTDAEMTAPSWAIPEKDAKGVTIGFEPKFEYATGDGEQLMHDFNGTQAPVKMVTDDVFQSLKSNAKAYIVQEARKYAELHNVPVSSPQVENFAKAIAYDELKNAAKTSTSIKDIIKTKENPAPHISVRVSTAGKGGSEVNVNDVYGRISDKVNEDIAGNDTPNAKVYTRTNALDSDAITIITDAVKKALPDNSKLGIENLYLHKDNGVIYIYKTDDDGKVVIDEKHKITAMPRMATNLKAQPSVKEKRAVINQGNQNTTPTPATSKYDKYKVKK